MARALTLPSSRTSQAGRPPPPPPKSAVSPQGPKHWESHGAGDGCKTRLHQNVALLLLEGVSSETGSEPLKGGPAGEGSPLQLVSTPPLLKSGLGHTACSRV